MKLTKMISNREIFGKKPQNSNPPKEVLLTGRKGTLAKTTHSPVAIQLGKIAFRSKADTKNTN